MQPILEFIPIVLFFLAYFSKQTFNLGGFELELGNIYSATLVLMVAMALQLIAVYLLYRKIEKRYWITFVIVLVFGGLTLFLKNNLFIQWKPTIVNWVFTSAFVFAPYFMQGMPLVKKVMGNKLSMPDPIWNKLTRFLIIYFFLMGVLNLIVVYTLSEAGWVKFKLWSAPFATIFMTAVIMYIVYPYIDRSKLGGESSLESSSDE